MNITQIEAEQPHLPLAPGASEHKDGMPNSIDERLEEFQQTLRKLARYLKDPALFAELQEYYFKPIRRNVRRQSTKAALRGLGDLEKHVAMLGLVIRRSRIRPSRRGKSRL